MALAAARPALCAGPSQLRRAGQPAAQAARPLLPLRRARAPLRVQASKANPYAHMNVDDAIKEQTRKTARTVFDFERWEAHRCSGRYFRHILGVFNSRIIFGLLRPLMLVILTATAVVMWESLRQAGVLPPVVPSVQLAWSKELFGLTSFALSLLLVFHTNAGYERWDGARKIWGLMLNRSRDIARQGLTYIPRDQPHLRAMLCRWVPAFSRTLMCHLRQDSDFGAHLKGVLYPHEIEAVLSSTHRPNYVLQVISEIVKSARLPLAARVKMDQNITTFHDDLGGCERILKTPIPLSYTRHTGRFLMIWLLLLPFTLVGGCGVTTIPLCATIGFLLMGIDEIGVAIEEPFSILPLEAIANSALVNIRELEAAHQADPEPDFSAAEDHHTRTALDLVSATATAGTAQRAAAAAATAASAAAVAAAAAAAAAAGAPRSWPSSPAFAN